MSQALEAREKQEAITPEAGACAQLAAVSKIFRLFFMVSWPIYSFHLEGASCLIKEFGPVFGLGLSMALAVHVA